MKILLSLFLLLLTVPARAEMDPVVTGWTANHPKAQVSLGNWVSRYPDVAAKMFWWNEEHPYRAQAFIRWVAAQPNATLDDFTSHHPDWPVINELLAPNRAAVEAFMAWARVHPESIKDMTAKPRGFAWLGFHVFRPLWDTQSATTPPAEKAAPPQGP